MRVEILISQLQNVLKYELVTVQEALLREEAFGDQNNSKHSVSFTRSV